MSAKFNPIKFLQEVRSEGKKIVWPSRREAIASMISVCVMVFFFAVLLFLTDKIVEYGIWAIVALFEKLLG